MEKERKEKKWAADIWGIVSPWLLYYVVTLMTMLFAQSIIGKEKEHYIVCQMIAAVVAFFVMYFACYARDRRSAGAGGRKILQNAAEKRRVFAAKAVNIGMIILTIAFLAIGLNNIILMSPLASSDGYAEASEHFYAGTFLVEMLSSAVVTPLVEELVYRGIIFARLRRFVGVLPAVVVSSLIFALMHFNIVQFLYAFLIGLVLAFFMEKTGNVYGAVIGHMTANAIAVIRTEKGFLDGMLDQSPLAWGMSAACIAAGLFMLFLYVRWGKKSS